MLEVVHLAWMIGQEEEDGALVVELHKGTAGRVVPGLADPQYHLTGNHKVTYK